MTLTESQALLLLQIRQFHARHGFTPCLAELSLSMDLPMERVALEVEELREKGIMDWCRGRLSVLRLVQR